MNTPRRSWEITRSSSDESLEALDERERREGLDVSGLPIVVFGHRNVSWLGNVFYMLIEGMMFALVIASYFYLAHPLRHLASRRPRPAIRRIRFGQCRGFSYQHNSCALDTTAGPLRGSRKNQNWDS